MHANKITFLAVTLLLLSIMNTVSVTLDGRQSETEIEQEIDLENRFNPSANDPIWNFTFDFGGNNQYDRGYSIAETNDGGFVVAGETNQDFWVLRVDANGTEIWNKTVDNGSLERAWDVVEVSTGGYAACGYVRISSWNYFYLVKFDVDGNVNWMRNYTGRSNYEARALAETDDGGFILVGRGHYGGGMYVVRTDSDGNETWSTTITDGDTLAGYDVIDLEGTSGYMVAARKENSTNDYMSLNKLDEDGTLLWKAEHGGPDTEYVFGMTNSSDGGYVLCGTSASWGAGGYDMYIVKFDGVGNLQWNRTYGSAGTEMCMSITSAPDGGYMLAGYTSGTGEDIWLVRTDAEGEVWWDETIHHSGDARPDKVVKVNDGGYALSGYVDPSSGDWDLCVYRISEPRWDSAPGNHMLVFDEFLNYDINATSTDGPIKWSINNTDYFSIGANGVLENTTTIPIGNYPLQVRAEDAHGHYIQADIEIAVRLGSGNVIFNNGRRVRANALVETPEGDFVIVTASDAIFKGGSQPWIVQYNIKGDRVWDRYFPEGYYLRNIVRCSSGGYAAVGIATPVVAADNEFWLLKIDEKGEHVWNSTFVKTDDDHAWGLVETPDGGFLLCGSSHEMPGGTLDVWIIKTDSDGNHVWNRTYGYPSHNDGGYSIVTTVGGGYVLAGYTEGSGTASSDAWLLGIDEEGNQLWNRTYGGTNDYIAYGVIQLSSGDYAITGTATPSIGGLSDAFVIRTNGTGFMRWNTL